MPEIITDTVYQTSRNTLYFCDQEEKFIWESSHDKVPFFLCQLITFRKKIQSLSIQQLLESHTPDIELIYIPHADRFILLDLFEILDLQELLDGAFTMLELNSVIHQKLLRRIGI